MNTKCCDSAQLPPQPPSAAPWEPHGRGPRGAAGAARAGRLRDWPPQRPVRVRLPCAPQEWGSESPALELLRRALRRSGGAESKDQRARGAPSPGPPPLPAGFPTETPADKGVWGEGAASAERSARCYRPVPAARTAARKSGHARAGRGQREGPPARRALGRAGAQGGSGGRGRLPAPFPRLRDLRREGGSAAGASPGTGPRGPSSARRAGRLPPVEQKSRSPGGSGSAGPGPRLRASGAGAPAGPRQAAALCPHGGGKDRRTLHIPAGGRAPKRWLARVPPAAPGAPRGAHSFAGGAGRRPQLTLLLTSTALPS